MQCRILPETWENCISVKRGFYEFGSCLFLTGLTTGGLSCLAVQGGLLASSQQQVEQTIPVQPWKSPSRRGSKNAKSASRRIVPDLSEQDRALITLFLGAKLMAYTLLGLLVWLGSVFGADPFCAVMQLAIGIFMVGMALRILLECASFLPP